MPQSHTMTHLFQICEETGESEGCSDRVWVGRAKYCLTAGQCTAIECLSLDVVGALHSDLVSRKEGKTVEREYG